MNSIRVIPVLIVLVLFTVGCSEKKPEALPASGKIKKEVKKLPPREIKNLVKLEKDILEGRVQLSDSIEKFKNGDYYQVIGASSAPGQKPMKKKAAEADAKRWGAILMKYLLQGVTETDLKGEYVDFLIFDGGYFDPSDNTFYMIYRFKEREI